MTFDKSMVDVCASCNAAEDVYICTIGLFRFPLCPNCMDTLRRNIGAHLHQTKETLGQIVVNTSKGQIIATQAGDVDYPGIFIDFQKKGDTYTRPVCLAEKTPDLACKDGTTEKGQVRLLIWEDPNSEDYTTEVILD